MKVRLITVPYDSGHRQTRMGRGPGEFLERNIERRLTQSGNQIAITAIAPSSEFTTEIKTSFELYRALATEVRKVRAFDDRHTVLEAGVRAIEAIVVSQADARPH